MNRVSCISHLFHTPWMMMNISCILDMTKILRIPLWIGHYSITGKWIKPFNFVLSLNIFIFVSYHLITKIVSKKMFWCHIKDQSRSKCLSIVMLRFTSFYIVRVLYCTLCAFYTAHCACFILYIVRVLYCTLCAFYTVHCARFILRIVQVLYCTLCVFNTAHCARFKLHIVRVL